MNIKQVEAVLRAVKSVCPAQYMDEFTANAWHPALADVDVMAAVRAVGELSMDPKNVYIRPAMIAEFLGREAADPMERAIIPAPEVDPDDVAAWMLAYRANVRAVREAIDAGVWRNPDETPNLDNLARQRALVGQAFRVAALAPAAPVGGPDRPDEWFSMRVTVSGHSEEFWRRRAEANTVPCRHQGCEAPIDRPCHLDGIVLANSPAHTVRLVDAGLEAAPPPPISPDRFKAMIDSGEIV